MKYNGYSLDEWKALHPVIADRCQLTSTEYRVLQILEGNCLDGTRESFIGRKELAARARVSESQTRWATKMLEDVGLIRIFQPGDVPPSGMIRRGYKSTYVLL